VQIDAADGGEFSLFEAEEQALRDAEDMVRKLDEVSGGVRALADAYRRGYREQRRLVRLSDRMQGELHRANRNLTEQARTLRDLNAALEAEIEERERLTRELERLATVDELTGLFGRRHFMTLAERELARLDRTGTSLVAMMLDIDRFKAVNDTHGHAAGDAVLRAFGAVLRRELRQVDIAGRVGGEEFAVLLPDTPPDQGFAVAERLRQATTSIGRALDPATDDGAPGQVRPVPVTVSIGVTAYAATDTVDALLKRADAALYAAKRAGRDRVISWTADLAEPS
jgi:diguanylate cyclase (GGDEF)-like protein